MNMEIERCWWDVNENRCDGGGAGAGDVKCQEDMDRRLRKPSRVHSTVLLTEYLRNIRAQYLVLHSARCLDAIVIKVENRCPHIL